MDFSKNCYVIAHRGASAYYPENTMSAFKGALELKADMIELDVLLTKDRIPIVFHDEKLNKKTNGKGLTQDFTLTELQELDAGSWFDKKFKEEKIPTLLEVLEFSKGKILVNIEIKTEAVSDIEKGGVVQIIIEMLKDLEMEEQVILSSFDYRAIERVNKYSKDIKTALLYEKKQSSNKTPATLIEEYEVDAFNCSKKQLSEKWISELNNSRIPYFIYTVNKKEEMLSLIKHGAKGIFSDKPDVLKRVADEFFRKELM